jgi:RNA polymerase sigma factor (TIGR02999 family)
MRRILIEAARRKKRQQHGAQLQCCELTEDRSVTYPVSDELLDLDSAIISLEMVDEQAAQVIKMRLFAGMTMKEIAEHLGVSSDTARRTWAYARAWLGREIRK